MVDTQKIIEKIKAEGKNQKMIAELLQISQCTVSLKLNNKRPFFLEEALKLAEFLRITDEEFSSYFFAKEIA